MKILIQQLKTHSLKVTPQRLAIFKMLYETTKHPSAELIYKELQETHPSMSLATVYKTLDTLKKSGLIQELNVGEDSFRYDANPHSHPHIICVKCHEVYNLSLLTSMEILRQEVAKQTEFVLLHEQLYFYGLCTVCQGNSKQLL